MKYWLLKNTEKHIRGKKLKTTFIFFIFLIFTIIPVKSMDFMVTPILPENQRIGIRGYFDLLLEPGQEQDVYIIITNSSQDDITITIDIFTVSTNRNGIIDYSARGIIDDSIELNLDDIITIAEPNITIPGNSEVQVPITINIPDEPFDGVLLGSIFVLRGVTEEERTAAGMIVNQFAFATAIQLQVSEEPVDFHFELGEVSVQVTDWRASYIAEIHNKVPRMIGGAIVNARVFPLGLDTPIFVDTTRVSFAPNTVFPLTLIDRIGAGVAAGMYTIEVSIEYDDNTWTFSQDFEIIEEEAAFINENAIAPPDLGAEQFIIATEGNSPLFWILVSSAAAICIAGLVIVILLIRKRQRKKYNDLMKQRNAEKQNELLENLLG